LTSRACIASVTAERRVTASVELSVPLSPSLRVMRYREILAHVGRREVEIKAKVDDMLRDIQDLVEREPDPKPRRKEPG
jgi:hypothetical protein